MSRRKKSLALTLSLFACLAVALVPTAGCNAGKTVVATYQGGEVTEAEMMKQFHFQRSLLLPSYQESEENKKSFLHEYITLHKVLVAEAKTAGVKIDETTISGDIEQYKDQVTDMVFSGDRSKLEAEMKKYKLSDGDIKQLVVDDYYLREFKKQKTKDVTVTPQESQAFFDHDPSIFLTGTVSHILVASEEEAKKVKDRLAQGEDFAKVAKEVSIDPTAKLNGGTMANVTFDSFEQDFRQAAAQAPVGQLSDPVHTAYGWHILRVDKRSNPKFEDVKPDAEQKALEDKQNAVWQAYYEQTEQRAGIQIILPK
ncbi:peptidylprolyl isomerase [Tumebacillus permanentifrigoris]|uniref:Foldase protein PrsA n=1 Tax=Tumebacillus permanentifrigoris TaxID=378543 RepID=A0A316D5G2_9BACL|nr:peptidylprolyl isomerase [Tumebacillus permanentifrigoris]PWK07896.1 foldase protein PrsA [Tumebacillus permanentifrigoris]